VNKNKEVRLHLPVALSCVCKKANKPFSRDEKMVAVEKATPKI
jgi:hypothetical protein